MLHISTKFEVHVSFVYKVMVHIPSLHFVLALMVNVKSVLADTRDM